MKTNLNKILIEIAKEKTIREIRFVIQPTLYKEFDKICKNKNETISNVLRNYILDYIMSNYSENENS